MGGDAAAIRRLDTHFTQLNAGPRSLYAFMGNEPEFGVPWAYDFAGAPAHTQIVTRRIETALFHDTPDGLPGNDDGGSLSSWFVFAALGLYPAVPGVPGFVLGSPLFQSATLDLAGGHTLRIDAPAAAADVPYVAGLQLNGAPYPRVWLPFAAVADGASLTFDLRSTPQSWGSGSGGGPPAFITP